MPFDTLPHHHCTMARNPGILGLIPAALILLSQAAIAQLGETADTCTKNYGPVVQKVPAVIPGGDATAHLHRRKDLDVTVHFKNGRASHITYAKGFLSDSEKAALLAENVGSATWRRPLGDRIGNVIIWITESNNIVVSAFELPDLMILEVMTRAWADELTRQRDERILAAQRGGTGAAKQDPQAQPTVPK